MADARACEGTRVHPKQSPPRGGALTLGNSCFLFCAVQYAVGPGMSRTGCSGCPAARPDGRVRRTIDAPLAAGGAPQRTVRSRMQRAMGACRSALGTDGGVGGAVQVARRCGTQTHGEPGDEADSEWFHHASFSVTCPHARMPTGPYRSGDSRAGNARSLAVRGLPNSQYALSCQRCSNHEQFSE